jgi:hypothetical protein
MRTELGSQAREPGKASSPLWRILQGIFVLGIGIVFIVINSSSPYKETTGTIQSISDLNGSSYLRLNANPGDLYIFDKSALHPAWTGQFTVTYERVDIYYNSDDTPKRIVALQMYDLAGHPTMKYTTAEYTDSLNTSPLSNISLDAGVVLILLGALWAGRGVFLLFRTRR